MSPPATPSPTTPSNPSSAAKAANPGLRVRRFFCRFSPAGSVPRTGDRALRPSFFRRCPPSAKLFPLKTVYSYGTIFADEVML